MNARGERDMYFSKSWRQERCPLLPVCFFLFLLTFSFFFLGPPSVKWVSQVQTMRERPNEEYDSNLMGDKFHNSNKLHYGVVISTLKMSFYIFSYMNFLVIFSVSEPMMTFMRFQRHNSHK